MKKFAHVFAFLASALVVAQTPGTLDTSFNEDGFDRFYFVQPNYTNWSRSIAVDEARIYVAGGASDGAMNRTSCVVYTLDGLLDSTFSGDGKFQLVEAGNGGAVDILIQPDGKIVLFSSLATGLSITRLNQDGTLDTTFSDDGNLTFDPTQQQDFGVRMALQHDGKLLVAGYSDTASRTEFVGRFNADGTLDTSYGDNGFFKYIMPTYNGLLRSIAIQPDGRALVTISEGIVVNNHSHVLRLNTDGTLDTTFNETGYLISVDHYFNAIQMLPNGQFLLSDSTNGYARIYRFNPDGQIDTTFNGVGYCTTEMFLSVYDLAIRNGKIILAGTTYTTSNFVRDYAVFIFNEDGTPDLEFGNAGLAVVDLGDTDEDARRCAIQNDGKIVITGQGNGITRFTTMRFHGPNYVLGTSEQSQTHIELYPNPSTGNLNLHFGESVPKLKITVYDILGRIVAEEQFDDTDHAAMTIVGQTGLYCVKSEIPGEAPRTFKWLRN